MKITILGCGHMGMAYAIGLRKYGLVEKGDLWLVARNADRAAHLREHGQVTTHTQEALDNCQLLIVAVKPQDFEHVVPAVSAALRPDQVVLSVMAGITLQRLRTDLEHNTVVRAMPNGPARLGKGITAYATHADLNMRQVLLVEQVLGCTGRTIHLEEEAWLDPVTALSGSGPAYFFEVVRTMVDQGVRLGLPMHISAALVKQTMLGSLYLLEQGEQTPEELIKAVMSKGGTTEAAFRVFAEGDMTGTLARGIAAASARATELAKA
jgi:pyrroline-5-carboxylate reductase